MTDPAQLPPTFHNISDRMLERKLQSLKPGSVVILTDARKNLHHIFPGRVQDSLEIHRFQRTLTAKTRPVFTVDGTIPRFFKRNPSIQKLIGSIREIQEAWNSIKSL